MNILFTDKDTLNDYSSKTISFIDLLIGNARPFLQKGDYKKISKVHVGLTTTIFSKTIPSGIMMVDRFNGSAVMIGKKEHKPSYNIISDTTTLLVVFNNVNFKTDTTSRIDLITSIINDLVSTYGYTDDNVYIKNMRMSILAISEEYKMID
jgi:hypothetical protein